MQATRKRWSALVMVVGLVGTAVIATGCSIHTQGPIREVAYDFSDSDFYDRAYAPSPQYRGVASYDPLHEPAAPLEVAQLATVDSVEVETVSVELPKPAAEAEAATLTPQAASTLLGQ